MTSIQRLGRRLRRVLRHEYLRLVRIDDTPEKLAGGVALGVFLGIFPTIGFGIILAIALASWFHVNKAAAVFGSLIMNPLTTPFFWTLSYTVGALVFHVDGGKIMEEARQIGSSWAGVGRGALIYLVGNTIVAAVFAGGGYGITKRLAAVVHAKRWRRRRRQEVRRAEAAAAAAPGRVRAPGGPSRTNSAGARPHA
jgi:uncharacterized protein (DUF2062 family)